ncbi:MAG: sulfotransferase domain-containing protein [Rhizomicrobium sp.]
MIAPAGIVWLASFPKSGNTWFRIFLANLAAGENGPADINMLDERGGIASSRHEFEAATMLDSSLLSHDDIDGLRPRVYEHIAGEAREQRWIKVHDAYTALPDGEPMLGRSARAAIYLVRDPRDVAVSLSHHNNIPIDSAIARMNDRGSAFSRKPKDLAQQLRQKLLGWSGHAASWIDQMDVPVHVVRYEALRADPMAHFSAALVFAGRPATNDAIARAIRHADFSELQRQEREKGFAERQSRSAPFFRSGRVGGWQDVLSAEQVARIEGAHAPMMYRLGYSMPGGRSPCKPVGL